MITQKIIVLPPFEQGIHIVTNLIVPVLQPLPPSAMVNLFIQHTSAALTINENADPTVRSDMKSFLAKLVPENTPYFEHILEGSDDMPSHILSSLLGHSVSIPVRDGKLALGIWQGIYLCEFRRRAGARKILATIYS